MTVALRNSVAIRLVSIRQNISRVSNFFQENNYLRRFQIISATLEMQEPVEEALHNDFQL